MRLKDTATILPATRIGVLALACACCTVLPLRAATLSSKGEVDHSLAMPELPDTEIGRILTQYYSLGLGGPEAWEPFESLKLIGTLRHDSSSYKLTVLSKKPDWVKQEIQTDSLTCLKGYDGVTAWRKSRQKDPVERMPEDEAEAFALNALVGSQLLYPYAEGKRIELIETIPLDGHVCHHLRVSFADKETVLDYFIALPEYYEVKRILRNRKEAHTHTTEFSNYERIQGIPIAFKQIHSRDNQERSVWTIKQVRINGGIMPWMFTCPE